ncbi:methionine adenosyltransferase [Mycoplasma phocoenae]|uniref:S-adenosylmethionine synthase n=1 Tax=Mycoplasma phocoenae TaxID=754517 RepID=A0A858U3V9_9MOLU|nr:methionine adenosyltransferase [Mycoplasma phocoenae]QJG66739.1 methionine adenosyltransferase [Mycoplasma phocoenae]
MYFFTSESVGAGHPDKICDQISDAILDAILANDKDARVACEVFATNRMIVIGGEITTNTYVDVVSIAWTVVEKLGYNENDFSIISAINSQSPDIAQGVNKANDIGAGDQGMVFGYATDETKEYMPLTLVISHELVKRAEILRNSILSEYIKSDMKSQVTVKWEKGAQVVSQVLMSIQHFADVDQIKLKDLIKKEVVDPVLEKYKQSTDVTFLFNPTGRFVIGGPIGDTGLTGRKIIVDTYGGRARHGGGAFSGKDYTKIDRSAAYMARYIAKNLVAAGISKSLEIQLSYAIGMPKPQSIFIDTFNTSEYTDDQIIQIINELFDLSVKGIIETLDLKNAKYLPTATYGHFGRDDQSFSWEKLDKVKDIQKIINSI